MTRVVLASGKIAHEAIAKRDEIAAHHVAIVRVEQLYPWPTAEIERVLASYPNLAEVLWLQEEPENMGSWPFVHLRMHHEFRRTQRVARRARRVGEPGDGQRPRARRRTGGPPRASASVSPAKSARLRVVVDGSNLATEGRVTPSFTQLDEAVSAFREENPRRRDHRGRRRDL